MTSLGDDLVQAREFVTIALTNMDMLLSDLRMDHPRAIETVQHLQSGAKKLQARGIYRATGSVIESYQNQHGQPKIDGRLMALYKLVTQYCEGLDEIAPLQTSLRKTEPPQTAASPDILFDRARTTLTELLPFAKDDTQSLIRLMELNLDEPAQLLAQTSFESLMPDVTDKALRNARGQGKSVSISYTAENLLLEDSQVEKVRAELDQIVARLVRAKIGTPEQRQSEGLPRSGHIDVCAKQGPKGLDISVLCEDETVHILRPSEFVQKAEDHAAPTTMEVGA